MESALSELEEQEIRELRSALALFRTMNAPIRVAEVEARLAGNA